MIRAMQRADAPEVLALLEWMDDRPEREVFAPEARTPEDLHLESAHKTCFVDVDDFGQVRAYCGLAPLFWDGGDTEQVLEGPLGSEVNGLLLRQVLKRADGGVYAFCARDNAPIRAVLEEANFSPMHATDFYELRRGRALPDREVPENHTLARGADPDAYRALFQASGDAWSGRLSWSRARLIAHLRREDLRLLVLRREGAALGFAELELGETAQLTYLAVHPAERGRGLGGALLRGALREAFSHSEVRRVRARAQDHEQAARKLYERHGFGASRSVMTYLRDAPD